MGAYHVNDGLCLPACRGVFPRPADISKEFGGGRTLRPGEVGAAPFSRMQAKPY